MRYEEKKKALVISRNHYSNINAKVRYLVRNHIVFVTFHQLPDQFQQILPLPGGPFPPASLNTLQHLVQLLGGEILAGLQCEQLQLPFTPAPGHGVARQAGEELCALAL